MEITRISRTPPSEKKTPSKLPIGRAAVALGFALPAAVLLPGCVPVEMIPTPGFWAQQTEHKPIRVVSENLNTIPQSTRQTIETKSKSSITEALIFDVSQGNPDGYVIDKTQNNASGISFDLYALSNGKMVGAFPSEDGTVNMSEVIGVDEMTNDGHVYRTLKTIINNNGKDKEYVFIALGYGQVETVNNILSIDLTEQQALVRSQIEKNQIESIIFGNPYLPSPNAIVLIEDENFQGQKDTTFTDSIKNIKYKVVSIPTQQVISSTNTPKSPTHTPTETATVTPTPTPTAVPTETATPTPEPMNINIDLKNVDVDKLPVINMSEVESGKLTTTILQLYDTGQIENISSSAKPFLEKSHELTEYSNGAVMMGLNINKGALHDQYISFSTNPETRPYKAAAVNAIDVKGKTLLLLSEVYLNRDGTVGVVHYAIESFAIPEVAEQIRRTLGGEFLPDAVLKIPPSFDGFGWFDYGKEPTMLKYYAAQDEKKLMEAPQEWSDTGNIPMNLSNMIFIPFMDPLATKH